MAEAIYPQQELLGGTKIYKKNLLKKVYDKV